MQEGEIEPGYRRAFVLAGNATFTLVGKASRYTFRVRETQNKNRATKFYIYLLRGRDNESDYVFVGGVLDNGEMYVSKKSPVHADAPSMQALCWFWRNLESPQVAVLHAGTCGRCGRLLTTPESIRTGFGPVCATL